MEVEAEDEDAMVSNQQLSQKTIICTYSDDTKKNRKKRNLSFMTALN